MPAQEKSQLPLETGKVLNTAPSVALFVGRGLLFLLVDTVAQPSSSSIMVSMPGLAKSRLNKKSRESRSIFYILYIRCGLLIFL